MLCHCGKRVTFPRALVGIQAEATLALVLHLHGQPPEGAGSSCTSRRCQLKPAWFLCHGRVTLLL